MWLDVLRRRGAADEGPDELRKCRRGGCGAGWIPSRRSGGGEVACKEEDGGVGARRAAMGWAAGSRGWAGTRLERWAHNTTGFGPWAGIDSFEAF